MYSRYPLHLFRRSVHNYTIFNNIIYLTRRCRDPRVPTYLRTLVFVNNIKFNQTVFYDFQRSASSDILYAGFLHKLTDWNTTRKKIYIVNYNLSRVGTYSGTDIYIHIHILCIYRTYSGNRSEAKEIAVSAAVAAVM